MNNMEKIKSYLREHINNWYKNTEIDYGVTGKFLDCVTAESYLFITFIENDRLFKCTISYYQEYNAEQLYNIWQESEWEKVA